MITKQFGDKTIIIRQPKQSDLKQPEKFQRYINDLVTENAMILICTKKSRKDETRWLKSILNETKKRKGVYLIAEHNNKIVGLTSVKMDNERHSHIGIFGISIAKECRGIGLGKFLMKEIINLAKAKLKPQLKIIRLSAYQGNKPALGLYQKMGFKQVATIPKQVQFDNKLINEIVMLLSI